MHPDPLSEAEGRLVSAALCRFYVKRACYARFWASHVNECVPELAPLPESRKYMRKRRMTASFEPPVHFVATAVGWMANPLENCV